MKSTEYLITSTIKENVLLQFLLVEGRPYNIHLGVKKNNKHYHSFFEIMYITKGNGIIKTDYKEYNVKSGDIFIFTENECHDLVNTSKDTLMDSIMISFAPRFIWSVGNDRFDLAFLDIFLNRGPNFENLVDRDNKTTKLIQNLLNEIKDEFFEMRPKYELSIKIKLLSILIHLIRDYDYVSKSNSISKENYNLKFIEQSMIYIKNNIGKHFTLEELAKESKMSTSYYSLLFKKLTGISPWTYIIEQRLDSAIDLLLETDFSINQIALKCGFNDITNFNKIFKKYMHYTPREYRSLKTKSI